MDFFRVFRHYDEYERRERAARITSKLAEDTLLTRVTELFAESARDEEACLAVSDGTKAVIVARRKEIALLIFVLMREKYGAKLYVVHDRLMIALDKAKLNEFLKNEGVFTVVDQKRVRFVNGVELGDSYVPVLMQNEFVGFIYDLMYADKEEFTMLCNSKFARVSPRAIAKEQDGSAGEDGEEN
ncbi:MAG: hypothetical protein ACP5HQ_03115 [Thermoprotei archaeon]